MKKHQLIHIGMLASVGLVLLISSGAQAEKNKTYVCHKPGTPDQKILNISSNAFPAHEAHGDHEVDTEICDGYDRDCNGIVDDGGDALCADGWTCTGIDGCQPPPVKHVFVTDFVTNGKIEYAGKVGIEAADAACNDEATTAGLQQSGAINFVAWLSDSTSNAVDDLTEGKFQLVDGTPIADSLSDLTDGTLQNRINLSADGERRDTIVWTGTNPAGIHVDSCGGDWNYDGRYPGATVGFTTMSDSYWTQVGPSECVSGYLLYCFEH